MSIAGLNLDTKGKAFPQIKAKYQQKVVNNNIGPVIFDSHFESGNLLYVFKNNDEKNCI